MPWPPSITFLLVASRISNGGTIWPAASASILTCPLVSLSTFSAKYLKLSCSVRLAGQVDWNLRLFDRRLLRGSAAGEERRGEAGDGGFQDRLSHGLLLWMDGPRVDARLPRAW